MAGYNISQAGLFQHFLEPNHHGMNDWCFQLIDKCDNEHNVREREPFWQFKLNTFLPWGLNGKMMYHQDISCLLFNIFIYRCIDTIIIFFCMIVHIDCE